MKTLLHTLTLSVLLILGYCATANRASATVGLPFYDGFNYSEGNLNAVAGGNWVVGNGSSTFEIAVSNGAALTAPAGFPAATGKGVRRAPSGTARRSVLQFPSQAAVDGKTFYVSFLLNVQTAPGAAQIILHLDNSSSSVTSPDLAIFVDNGPKVGIGKNSGSAGFTMATNLGAGTHLIVGRYTFQAGSDKVDLWVDPASSYYGASAAPTSLGSATNSGDPTSIDYCQIVTSSGSGGAQYIDEFRLGTNWADVVPSSGPLVGMKLGFTAQPADTQAGTTLNPVVVQVQTADGAAVASNGVPITLNLSSGSGTLSGTLTQNTDATGKATFNDLSVDIAGTGKQLTASASGIGAGLTNAVSSTFAITAEPPLPAGIPVITRIRIVPAGAEIQGSNGTASARYQVWGSPTLALPVSQWTLVANRYYDTGGAFICTNPVSLALPNLYYRLRSNVTNPPAPEPPSIRTQPASQTVAPGTTATFTVDVTGAPPLAFLWRFNNVPLWGETNSSLVLSDVQATQAGNYSVIVANAAGEAISGAASLQVGNFPPTIITQPGDQTAVEGQNAVFAVVATGTAPLSYQWYFNTNTPVAGATNASVTLTSVQMADAGAYSVEVANNVSSVRSTNAWLTVTEAPTNLPNFDQVGYSSIGGDVTGGAGGATNTVTDGTAFENLVWHTPGAMTVQVEGTIVLRTDSNVHILPNKTVIGLGTNATIIGNLMCHGDDDSATNIIIRNLTIINTNSTSGQDGDGVTVKYNAHHIWVDHCTFIDCNDGSLDVSRGSDYVTVSWCKFFYTVDHGHDNVNLIGGNDGDTGDAGKLHVTFHHNWWSDHCVERLPSVRYGRVHVFNNYYNAPGNSYCARTRISAEVLVENNFYENVQNPWELLTTEGITGKLKATGNNVAYLETAYGVTWVSGWYSGQSLIPGTDTLTMLQSPNDVYTYTLDAAANVPFLVTTYAGAGKGPFAP